MRTESEWAIFAKHVPVGTRFKFLFEGTILEGAILENYPHIQRSTFALEEIDIDMLQAQFDDYPEPMAILANYEHFWIWDGWYTFDDILMGDSDPQPGFNQLGWEASCADLFWDRFNEIALHETYMPNAADDVCEAQS